MSLERLHYPYGIVLSGQNIHHFVSLQAQYVVKSNCPNGLYIDSPGNKVSHGFTVVNKGKPIFLKVVILAQYFLAVSRASARIPSKKNRQVRQSQRCDYGTQRECD